MGDSMTDIASIKADFVRFRTSVAGPDAALVDLFLDRLSAWREDDSTVNDLIADLDRVLGQVWFSSNENHATVALLIACLRDTVASVGGMTMNERLVIFDLTDRWDRTATAQRGKLYQKVLAKQGCETT